MISDLPLILLEMTPIATPGSSPLVMAYAEPFTTTFCESLLTRLETLTDAIEELPTLGYGIGTGEGAGGAGVLHTSGNAAVTPELALCCVVRKLTVTVDGISWSLPLPAA